LWHALEQGRPGIAYHIARLLWEQGGAAPAPIADLIAASTLARHARSEDSGSVGALRGFIENIDPGDLLRADWGDHEKDAGNLLLFSATLRPTLFAPSTGAGSLLRRVSVSSEGLAPVYELAMSLADHADRLQGVRLDSSFFRAAGGGNWQEEFDSFVIRVGEWRTRAESKRNLFARADRVWHELLSGNGCLAELTALISRDDGTGRSRVEDIRKQIRDRKAFNELVLRTDKKGRKGDPIQGRALKQLWNDVQPALGLCAEWMRLLDVKSNANTRSYVNRRIDALRKDLVQYGHNAVHALGSVLANGATSVALVAASRQARMAVDELLRVLDSETEAEATESADQPNVIQSRDLVYVTALDLDKNYSPVLYDDAASLLALLLDTRAHADTPRAAFDARLARGDLVGALLACNLLEAEGGADTDRCRESLLGKLEGQRQELGRALAAGERRLEHAFTVDTPVRWEFGTASATGTRHAVLASLDDPPYEIRRRVWSAQASVLLPVIDGRRVEIIREHRTRLALHLHNEQKRMDPLELDVNALTGMIQRPGFDDAVRRSVRQMNAWRNDLAHLKSLSGAVRSLVASAGPASTQ